MEIIILAVIIIGAALLYSYLPEKRGRKFKSFIKMIMTCVPISAAINAYKGQKKEN